MPGDHQAASYYGVSHRMHVCHRPFEHMSTCHRRLAVEHHSGIPWKADSEGDRAFATPSLN